MEYFAGLDISMEETRVCVVNRDGVVIHEAKAPSTPSGIEAALAGAPTCRRVVFETGRMAPMLHHGLTERGVPVVCIESRQASQALKSLATRLQRYCEPLRHPRAPSLSLTGFRLVIADHALGLPVFRALSLCTCRRQYPGVAAGRNLRSTRPAISAFPDMAVGSAYTSSFSRCYGRRRGNCIHRR